MARARMRRVFPWAASPTQAADALDLSYDEVIKPAIRSGRLRCFKVGTKRRVTYLDCHRWLIREFRQVS